MSRTEEEDGTVPAGASEVVKRAAARLLARIYVVDRQQPVLPSGPRERERLDEDVDLAVRAVQAGIEAERRRVLRLLEVARDEDVPVGVLLELVTTEVR